VKRGQLTYLLGLMVIATVFAAVPDHVGNDVTFGFWLNDKVRLTAQTWCYFALIHTQFIMLAYFVWKETPIYDKPLKAWFWISCFHGLEYLLHYTSVWVEGDPINVSSRMGTMAIFGYYVYTYETD
jgi:hypothetical protein